MDPTDHRPSSERVLIVDDNAVNLRLLTANLRSAGFEITEASNGQEALTRIKEEPPDLVLLDVMMPELDGFETCTRIKMDAETRHIPVVLVTSLSAIEDKVKGQQVGADDFITKPFDRTELLLRVRSMLRIKSLHDQLVQKVSELEFARNKLAQLADTDDLTLLANRRHFQAYLTRELHRARRFHHSVAILMLDIDHFKRVNDTSGHPTGDFVLRQFASILTRCVRKSDLAARYGGEEFSLVLAETGTGGAESLATSLRNRIADHRFRDVKGRILEPITVSIGVSAFPEDGADEDALIEAADRRLYRAKAEGRNRVVVLS